MKWYNYHKEYVLFSDASNPDYLVSGGISDDSKRYGTLP